MKRFLASIFVISLLPLMGAQYTVGSRSFHHTTSSTNVVSAAAAGYGCESVSFGSPTSLACTTANTMLANQSMHVGIAWFSPANTATVAVSSGSCSSSLATPVTWYAGTGEYTSWTCTGFTVGSTVTVTVTFSAASGFPDLLAAAYTGTLSAPVIDGSVPAYATGLAATATCGNVTSSQNNAILSQMVNASGAITAGTTPQAMTVIQTAATNAIAYYGTAVTAGTNYSTATFSGTQYWVCDNIVWK